MLQLLKNLRTRSQGKEITDSDILKWANKKVRNTRGTTQIESFKVGFNVVYYIYHHVTHFDDDCFSCLIYRISGFRVEYSSYSF